MNWLPSGRLEGAEASSLYYEVADLDLHRFAVLVQCHYTHLDQAFGRARFRRPHLQHLAFDVQLIAGSHGAQPAEFIVGNFGPIGTGDGVE